MDANEAEVAVVGAAGAAAEITMMKVEQMKGNIWLVLMIEIFMIIRLLLL